MNGVVVALLVLCLAFHRSSLYGEAVYSSRLSNQNWRLTNLLAIYFDDHSDTLPFRSSTVLPFPLILYFDGVIAAGIEVDTPTKLCLSLQDTGLVIVSLYLHMNIFGIIVLTVA